MKIFPGNLIHCGRKSNPRNGTVLALFRSKTNEIFVGTAGHVITGAGKYPKSTNIYQDNLKVAKFNNKLPKGKFDYVDFLLAKIDEMEPPVDWSNRIDNSPVLLNEISHPIVGQELLMKGAKTTTRGIVDSIDKYRRYRYNFIIKWIDKSPKEWDSGAPWYTDNGNLVGMHLGVLAGNISKARVLYLSEVASYYEISLA